MDESTNTWIRQDMAVDHPISQGSHCCKGIDQIDLTKSKMRLKYPDDDVWRNLPAFAVVMGASSQASDIRVRSLVICVRRVERAAAEVDIDRGGVWFGSWLAVGAGEAGEI